MDLYFEISGNQIDGARDYQEDAFLTTYMDDDEGQPKSSALVIMADGMGGHAAGNIASNMVVSTFNKAFTGSFIGQAEVDDILRDALLKSNGALTASIKETPALDGMGCTMVTAAFNKGKLWWTSVGDSHLYLIRDRKLEKRNEDHSYGGYLDRMRAQGMDVEPEPGLSRNMLMSAMTGEDIAEIDCPNTAFQLLPEDRLIIASDGLDTISQGTIIQFSAWSKTPKECVEALLKAVEDAEKPRQDNTTVIVVDVLQRDAAPAPAPAPPAEKRSMGGTHPTDQEGLEEAKQAEAEAEIALPGAREAEPEPAAPEPAPAPPQVAAEAFPDDFQEPKKGGGKGVMIAIAAVVILAIAGGVFFVMGDKKEPRPATEMTTPEEETQQAAVEEAERVPEPERGAEETTAAETQPAEPAQEATQAAAKPEAAREFRDSLKGGGEGPLMVRLPGGRFEMGSGGVANQDERPRHFVTVKPFAVSKYEVTFAEYERFAQATGRKLPDNLYMDKETHPVIFVTWDDAFYYAKWMSEQTGKKYRLSSESEWEYAARGGTDTTYSWGFDVGRNQAHCFGCETGLDPRKPTGVGRFKPNAYGLFDTAGNVMEWVYDCYHPSYRDAPTDGIVWEGGDCSSRVARGGAFSNPPPSIRPAKRHKLRSTVPYDSVGIRLARDL
ncbi:MAG: hypothetical protein DRQ37_04265 [Gammaproteobacteria bacterium]|nr:MAG: hypothetical protein DRQ37_04265 [Gammaproteobacteria bacterium]